MTQYNGNKVLVEYNKVISFSWEENPKHIDDLLKILKLEDAKGTDVPGSKSVGENVYNAEDELPFEDAKVFQQGTGILLYTSPGRKEIQFAVSKLVAHMAKPKVISLLRLRKRWDPNQVACARKWIKSSA